MEGGKAIALGALKTRATNNTLRFVAQVGMDVGQNIKQKGHIEKKTAVVTTT